jgi:hypothetical protein
MLRSSSDNIAHFCPEKGFQCRSLARCDPGLVSIGPLLDPGAGRIADPVETQPSADEKLIFQKELSEKQNSCYRSRSWVNEPAPGGTPAGEEKARRKILFGIRRNPLKSPDSDE